MGCVKHLNVIAYGRNQILIAIFPQFQMNNAILQQNLCNAIQIDYSNFQKS